MTEYFNEQTPFLTHSAKYPVSSIKYPETSEYSLFNIQFSPSSSRSLPAIALAQASRAGDLVFKLSLGKVERQNKILKIP